MKHVELLDCTLRDGAYLVNKKFGYTTIVGIISGLINAQLDIIEIGFLQDDGSGNGTTIYKHAYDARQYLPCNKQNSKIAVLADYSRYHIENLESYDGQSIDIIRECFFKHEWIDAINACRNIKALGYDVFVQPVDILGYSDRELLDLIEAINTLEPYGMSIVDTFGSMYQEDLHRIFEIIHHNLAPTCKIGFHSHNNMQLSSALSQEFIRISDGKRKVVVDGTISGMGRGAGNTPIELLIQYMNSHYPYTYDLDAVLDLIDTYMESIRSKCHWGYSTSYFVAGCYGAHVNNIDYLEKKSSIRHKDMRVILNRIDLSERKRYNYDLLEQTYLELIQSDIDDSDTINHLKDKLWGHTILILVPGKTLMTDKTEVLDYIQKNSPIVISVNFIDDSFVCDYVYMNNVKRYKFWSNSKEFSKVKKILTSNIHENDHSDNEEIVSFAKHLKCGWEHLDNSTIMLLRLLDRIHVDKIAIAGFDGYSNQEGQNMNYYHNDLEIIKNSMDASKTNQEIAEMLYDFCKSRTHKDTMIEFVTPSRFEKCIFAEGDTVQ